MTELRYKAVLAVIADGRPVSEAASEWGACRQTMHRWLARYEGDGLEGLSKSFTIGRRTPSIRCPRQWRRSCSRCVASNRAGGIDPLQRQRRRESWTRWERDLEISPCALVSTKSTMAADLDRLPTGFGHSQL